MRYTQRRRRKLIIVCLFSVLIIMITGLNFFSDDIEIKGVSSATKNLDVVVTSVNETKVNGTSPTKSRKPYFSNNVIEFYPFLTSVGDSISYDVTVKNKGTIDVKIDMIMNADENNPAARFELSGINRWDIIKAGDSVQFTITIYFDERYAGQATGQLASLNIQFEFLQTNSSEKTTDSESVTQKNHIDVPGFSENFSSLTVLYPSGCGNKYVCTYNKDGEGDVLVTSKEAKIDFSKTGTVIAKVSDGNTVVSSSHKVLVYPIMMNFSKNSMSDFHSDKYRDKISYVEFLDACNIPDGVELFDISYYKDNSVMAYITDDGSGGYNLYICGLGEVMSKDLSYIFYNFKNLKSANLNKLNTKLTSGMKSFFEGCNNLDLLDLSGFDTSKTSNMSGMFKGCNSLKTIYVSDKFVTNQVLASSDMFKDCNSLIGGNGTVYSPNNLNKEYAIIDAFGQKGYFSSVN